MVYCCTDRAMKVIPEQWRQMTVFPEASGADVVKAS